MRLNILLTLLLSGLPFILVPAQDKKEFKNKFIEAEYFFLRGDFKEAGFLYNELLRSDPSNANLQFLTGACYLSLQGEKTKAIPYLEKAAASVSPAYREGSYKERNAPRESWFALAKAYHIAGRFDEAVEYYTRYKNVMRISEVAEIEFVQKQIQAVQLAKELMKDTLEIDYLPLDPEINFSASNYNAVFSGKDSMLIYMADKPFYPAIMMSKRAKGGWTSPDVLNPQLEADDDMFVSDVSYDGTELYLVRMDEYDKNLYVSYFEDGRWSRVIPLEGINSEFNEGHAGISRDKRTLVFTSDRPGGMGGMDLWIAERNPDGSWGTPFHAGNELNSIYSEASPFLSEDSKTIYFSSMGHATMGGYDIFYSRKLPSNKWSVPTNMGFPVNTTDDDLFFRPLQSGKAALYTSFHPALMPGQILSINLNPGEKDRLYAFQGTVVTGDALDLDENTKLTVSNTGSNGASQEFPVEQKGSFAFELPAGDYSMQIHSENYKTDTFHISILEGIPQKTILINQDLVPEKVADGEAIVIRNILFGFDSYEISRDAAFELEKLYKLMNLYPEIMVQVTGYADSKGSEAYNLELSRKRARAAVEYLVEKGLARERFISMAAGKSEKFASNTNPDGSDNPEGRRMNRQVEISLVNAEGSGARIEDVLVPERMKPTQAQSYFVVISIESAEKTGIPGSILNKEVKLWNQDQTWLYYTGKFPRREDAVEFLNEAIEMGYADAMILPESELNEVFDPQDKTPVEMTGPFTIQLMALKNPISLKQFGNKIKLQEFTGTDGIYRYTTGIWPDYEDVRQKLAEYVNAGFTDAFIMELSRYTGQKSAEPSAVYFSIQISATKNPPSNELKNRIPNLRISLEDDGFYHVYSGLFTSKPEAEKQLLSLRQSGFPDAFIRKVSSRE